MGPLFRGSDKTRTRGDIERRPAKSGTTIRALERLIKDLAEPYVFAAAFDEDTNTLRWRD